MIEWIQTRKKKCFDFNKTLYMHKIEYSWLEEISKQESMAYKKHIKVNNAAAFITDIKCDESTCVNPKSVVSIFDELIVSSMGVAVVGSDVGFMLGDTVSEVIFVSWSILVVSTTITSSVVYADELIISWVDANSRWKIHSVFVISMGNCPIFMNQQIQHLYNRHIVANASILERIKTIWWI